MNAITQIIELQVSEAKQKVAALKGVGKETAFEEANLKMLEAQLATSQGIFRLNLYRDSGEDDRYSLQRAVASFSAARDFYSDAVRLLQTLGGDPHGDVLKEAGIRDA